MVRLTRSARGAVIAVALALMVAGPARLQLHPHGSSTTCTRFSCYRRAPRARLTSRATRSGILAHGPRSAMEGCRGRCAPTVPT